MTKKTAFVSDLHLSSEHTKTTELFLAFLAEYTPRIEALYILGDFFNVWIGDDDDSAFNQTIKTTLKNTSDQIPVYLMHGNRDFLIGKRFAREAGCTLISDPTKIDLYGIPTLLIHGDTLCTNDHRHMKFRKCVQHSFTKHLYLSLPLSLRKKIASMLRRKSIQHTSTAPRVSMQAVATKVQHVMLEHHVNQLIHGHTHSHKEHFFELNNQPAKRIVLGDWEKSGSVLIFEAENPLKHKLIRFPIES